jgi:hypothetical protein
MYMEDFWLNIHLMYVGIRRISDQIFNWCMNRSGGWLTEYSFSVCRDPVDYWLNIHSVYEWVRRIADWIFIWCMQGSGGWLTEYSFCVCRVRRITNWIFNSWNNRIKQVKSKYSIVGMIGIHGSKYLIVGMTRLVGLELNIQ